MIFLNHVNYFKLISHSNLPTINNLLIIWYPTSTHLMLMEQFMNLIYLIPKCKNQFPSGNKNSKDNCLKNRLHSKNWGGINHSNTKLPFECIMQKYNNWFSVDLAKAKEHLILYLMAQNYMTNIGKKKSYIKKI